MGIIEFDTKYVHVNGKPALKGFNSEIESFSIDKETETFSYIAVDGYGVLEEYECQSGNYSKDVIIRFINMGSYQAQEKEVSVSDDEFDSILMI